MAEIADFLQANLWRGVIERPERERDVQNVVEQLLIGRGLEKGIDYDREVGRVKVSSKEVVPDFVLPQLHVVQVTDTPKQPGVGLRPASES